MNSTISQAAPPGKKQVLALLLIALLVYLPSVGNGFPMDDQPLAESVQREHGPVVTDPAVGEWQSPLFYFSHHYWYPHHEEGGLYRPVTVWSFALTYNLVGRFLPPDWEAGPHHLLNVLLHVWATWLVLQMVLVLGVPTRAALLTTILFGLHALHSEAVVSIVGRAELFSFCFGAQAVLLFVRGGTWRCVAAAALLFLAACSKESAVAWFAFLPCFLLAHAWMRDPSLGLGQVLGADLRRLLLVLLVPLAAWALARWSVVGGHEVKAAFSTNELAFVPDETRILTAVKIWGYGLYKCFAPFSLACIYSAVVFQMVETPLDWGFLASASALLLFLALGLRYARRAPLLFLAMALFLGFSFITSNVPTAIGTVFGERVYYTPSLGICLLPAMLLARLRPKYQQLLMLVLVFWTAGCCAIVLHRNFVWKNDETLFLNDIQVQPKSIDLHRKAAGVYMEGEKKDLNKAMALLVDAVHLDKEYPLALLDMGSIQMERREWKGAIKKYQRVLESKYLEPSGAAPLAHINIGKCWLALGDIKKAAAAFKESIHLEPRYKEAWVQLAGCAPKALPKTEVQQLFDRGLGLFPLPRYPDVWLYLGGMAYQADLDPARVAQVLGAAIGNLPPSEHAKDNTFIAKLYYASALEQLQQIPLARRVYEDVGNDPACPQDLRNKARERLDATRKQR